VPKTFYGQSLAEVHSSHYSDFAKKASAGVIAALRRAGIRRGLVLDLGCGGGPLSAALVRRGYDAIGVDVSAAMVALARKNVPQAKFVQGSVMSVELPKAAAAVAIGEVFNYLESTAQLRLAFQNVAQALEPGALFIFDIKEPLPGAGTNTYTSARWGDDWAVSVKVSEHPGNGVLIRDIVAFRKQGRAYMRADERHRQILLKSNDVIDELRKVGFSASAKSHYGKLKVPQDRRVIVAQKN
jgi:SAM-dependent methyltransferase